AGAIESFEHQAAVGVVDRAQRDPPLGAVGIVGEVPQRVCVPLDDLANRMTGRFEWVVARREPVRAGQKTALARELRIGVIGVSELVGHPYRLIVMCQQVATRYPQQREVTL